MVTRVRFTWDEGKNAVYKRKHRIGFEFAAHVFIDPLYLSVRDQIEGAERRW